MKPYKYEPIVADEYAFRLILLHPGSESKITIEIFHALLDKESDKHLMPYEAVSYVWGDPQMCGRVYIHNPKATESEKTSGSKTAPVPQEGPAYESILYVTNSLELVLRDLRLLDKKRCLWVDGICINQNDQNDQQSKEKNHQVKLMGTIYSRAEKVLLHLGRPTDMTPILRDTIDELQKYQDTRSIHNEKSLQDLEQELEQTTQKLKELQEFPETEDLQELQELPETEDLQELEDLKKEPEDRLHKLNEEQEPQELPKLQNSEDLLRPSEISEQHWEQVSGNLFSSYYNFHQRIKESLEYVIAQPWFRRVWIIQEVANARAALIYWGPTPLSVRWFVDLARKVGVQLDTQQNAILDLMPRSRRYKLDLSSGQDLYNLLEWFGEAQASKSHDKIFALLGMCKHRKGLGTIDIDYSKDLDCVVRDAVAYMTQCNKSDVPREFTSIDHLTRNISSLFDDLTVEFAVNSQVKSLRALLHHRGDQIIITPAIIETAIKRDTDVEVMRILLSHRISTIIAPITTLEHTLSRGDFDMAEVLLHRCAESRPVTAKWTRAAIAGIGYETRATRQISPLGQAVYAGEVDEIRQLLKEGVNLNKFHRGRTPLSQAVIDGRQEICEILLDHGADVDLEGPDPSSVSDLYRKLRLNGKRDEVDVKYSNPWSLSHLSRRLRLNGKRDKVDRPALLHAIQFGHEGIAKPPLVRSANVEALDGNKQTALALAIQIGHEGIVQILLDRNANIEALDGNNQTALALAVRFGHKGIVKTLLDRNANIEALDGNNQTALALAVKIGYEGIVKTLLDRNANIEALDGHNQTALALAVLFGHKGIVQTLLDRNANIEASDGNKQTALALAVHHGREDIVKILLARGANIETKDKNDRTPLSMAASGGFNKILSLGRSRHGKNIVELQNKRRSHKSGDQEYHYCELDIESTPTHVHERYSALLQLLLDKGAEVNVVDGHEQTPLWWAFNYGHQYAVEKLLENGANPEMIFRGKMSLFSWAIWNGYENITAQLLANSSLGVIPTDDSLEWAIRAGNEFLLQKLMERCTKTHATLELIPSPFLVAVEEGNALALQILIQHPVFPESSLLISEALLVATSKGSVNLVKMLLEAGADVNYKDSHGMTPLSRAVEKSDCKMVQLLLAKNGNPNGSERNDYTPLVCAIRNGSMAIVKDLIESKANVNAKGQNAMTALWEAAYGGHLEATRLLLDHGAEVNVCGNRGTTPLMWACRKGYSAIVELLLDREADITACDKLGRTVIDWAKSGGNEQIVQTLRARLRSSETVIEGSDDIH